MVPAGSTITLAVTGRTGGYVPTSANEVRSAVVNALSPFFLVYNVSIELGSPLQNALDFQWLFWQYTATVVLKTRADYSQVDDVSSVVAHAFYQAAGALPTVSVPSVQVDQLPAVVQNGPSIGGAVESVFAGLQTTTVLVLAAVIGALYLVAYGPNVGDVARAVR